MFNTILSILFILCMVCALFWSIFLSFDKLKLHPKSKNDEDNKN